VAPAYLADFRVPAFESLAAWHDVEKDLSGGGRPETLIGHAVTADFFAVLGVGPVLVRPFVPEEDREGGERVVILSDPLWRSRFGADPAIVGRTIRLDREPRRVVGVLPASFVTPGGLGSTRPVSLLVPAAFPAELLANRGDHEVKVVARLRPGARLEEARAQVRAVSERLAAQFPDTNGEVRADITALDDDVVRDVRGSLLLLLAAVDAVLAIACLNVANLQVVRALGRRRELAVCVALGAARGRLATGLLVESLLLAASGALRGWASRTGSSRASRPSPPPGPRASPRPRSTPASSPSPSSSRSPRASSSASSPPFTPHGRVPPSRSRRASGSTPRAPSSAGGARF
jgi:hypothetical protein